MEKPSAGVLRVMNFGLSEILLIKEQGLKAVCYKLGSIVPSFVSIPICFADKDFDVTISC